MFTRSACADRLYSRALSAALHSALLALLLATWSVSIGAAGGADPELVDLGTSVAGRELQASVHLLDAFDDRTRQRIESGLPTSFTYLFKLESKRRWWFDSTNVSSKLQVVAMYNAIDREYLVNYKLDGRLVQSRVVHDLDELERAMTVIGPVSVFELDGKLRLKLESLRDGRSVLRARAELGSSTFLGFIPTTRGSEWVEAAVPVDHLSQLPEPEPARPSLFQ